MVSLWLENSSFKIQFKPLWKRFLPICLFYPKYCKLLMSKDCPKHLPSYLVCTWTLESPWCIFLSFLFSISCAVCSWFLWCYKGRNHDGACRLPGTVTATANCQFPFSSLQSRHATGHLSPLSSSRCINICFRIEFQDISSLWCLRFQIYLSQPLPGYLMLPWCLESQSWFLFLVLEEQIFGKVATYLGKCSKYPW